MLFEDIQVQLIAYFKLLNKSAASEV